MAKDRDNVRIYGDDAGGVWVAPKGTTGPNGSSQITIDYRPDYRPDYDPD